MRQGGGEGGGIDLFQGTKINMIESTGKAEICRQAGDPGKSWSFRLNPKTLRRQNSLFLKGPQSSSWRPSTDWMRPTHIIELTQLNSKSTDLSVNLISRNTFTATPGLVFDQISGAVA